MKNTNEEKRERKKGLIGWFENLWFYHKWHISVGALMLIFLSIATVQCMKKVDPEITILFVGEADIGSDRDIIVEDFGHNAVDFNDNGEIDLSFAYFKHDDSNTANRFNTEILAGDHHIFIVNDAYFDKLVKSEALAPISSILGYTPENTEGDGYGIRLKYLAVAETGGFDKIDRNSILCFRSNADHDADYDNGTELYKNNYDFFKALLKYTDHNERVEVDLVCIGEQTLYTNTVYDIEYSVYNVGRKYDRDRVAIMNYEEQKILSNKHGVTIFGEEEQADVDELAQGNKILIVCEEVYVYLRDNGKLASLNTLGVEIDGSDKKFGRKLSSLAVDGTTDLTETPGFKSLNKELYICGTADIEGYTADMLKYLTQWTED